MGRVSGEGFWKIRGFKVLSIFKFCVVLFFYLSRIVGFNFFIEGFFWVRFWFGGKLKLEKDRVFYFKEYLVGELKAV